MNPGEYNSSRAVPLPTPVVDEDPVKARILNLMKDLCNPVLAKRRATEMLIIKTKRPAPFKHTSFFHKVMKLLEAHHFRLPVLRFVIDLFDKRVLRSIVLDEEESEVDEENEEESKEDMDDDLPPLDTTMASMADD